jgi:hypothetical protein
LVYKYLVGRGKLPKAIGQLEQAHDLSNAIYGPEHKFTQRYAYALETQTKKLKFRETIETETPLITLPTEAKNVYFTPTYVRHV